MSNYNKNHNFQIGDRVRVISSSHDTGKKSIGKEFNIIRFDDNDRGRIKLNDESCYVWYAGELELVTELPQINLNTYTFDTLALKVGDKVKVVIKIEGKKRDIYGVPSGCANWNSAMMDKIVGSDCVVTAIHTVTKSIIVNSESGFTFELPAACLRLVSRAPKETRVDLNEEYAGVISAEGLKIEGVLYPRAVLDALKEAADKQRAPKPAIDVNLRAGSYRTAVVSEEDIKVGCQTFSFEKLDAIIAEAKKYD